MMRRQGFILLFALTLTGCAGLRVADTPDTADVDSSPVTSAEQAIARANELAENGLWSRALDTLDSAANRFPGDAALEQARERFAERRDYRERALEDEMLVEDAENQQRKLVLLEQLARVEPGDLLTTSRRIYWKEVLAGKIERLTVCGETHADLQPTLAKRCYKAASGLDVSDDVERRLGQVAAQLREGENLAEQRRKARGEKERQLRAKALLDNAKAAIDAHDYRRALDILTRVAKLQPDNAEVAGLQQEAWAMISPQVEALIKLGDHLYLDEQLEAAVATWKAALNLKPQDEDILGRIERARTVLDRLDLLRKRQQQPGVAGHVDDS